LEVEKLNDKEIYRVGTEIQEIGNRAIKNVIKENRRMGIPLVFSRNGTIYYELPGGEITTESPFDSGFEF
jgi:hypothetical protein